MNPAWLFAADIAHPCPERRAIAVSLALFAFIPAYLRAFALSLTCLPAVTATGGPGRRPCGATFSAMALLAVSNSSANQKCNNRCATAASRAVRAAHPVVPMSTPQFRFARRTRGGTRGSRRSAGCCGGGLTVQAIGRALEVRCHTTPIGLELYE